MQRALVSIDPIPYSCHVAEDVILTRSGHLITTVKCTEFTDSKNAKSISEDLLALLASTPGFNNVAIKCHVVRDVIGSNFDQIVEKPYESPPILANTVYISLIARALDMRADLNGHTLFFGRGAEAALRQKLVDKTQELLALKNQLVSGLSSWSPEVLTIYLHGDAGPCSAQLELFQRLLAGTTTPMPASKSDASLVLSNFALEHVDSALRITSHAGEKYCGILSLKRFDGISPLGLSAICNSQTDFVISHQMCGISIKEGMQKLSKQFYVAQVSGADGFMELSGANACLESMCVCSTSIMLRADTALQLSDKSNEVMEVLSKIGIVPVREDINLENAYWAILPGNFRFDQRTNVMSLKKSCEMIAVGMKHFGQMQGKWGKYSAVLQQVSGHPYFFTIDNKSGNHLIIAGDSDVARLGVLTFITKIAHQAGANIVYLDAHRSAEHEVTALNGSYEILTLSNPGAVSLNPFCMPDTPDNRKFLRYWLAHLADKYSDSQGLAEFLSAADSVIDAAMKKPIQQRFLSALDRELEVFGSDAVTQMKKWLKDGKFGHVFGQQDVFESKNTLRAFDVTELHDQPVGISMPVLSYILHRFRYLQTAQNAKSLLVVADSNHILSNAYFEENLGFILDDLNAKSASVVLSASFNSTKVNWSEKIARTYGAKIESKMLVDNSVDQSVLKQMLGLTDSEIALASKVWPESTVLLCRDRHGTLLKM